jgi:anthranilate synthase/aminodeoxychorismate synthase-like glutamine amidotransferase
VFVMRDPSIVLIDNYDSFTYNLYQYLRLITPAVQVFRNDAVRVSHIAALDPDGIVISPGPKEPKDAGISKDVIAILGATCPVLGVCLGHQCINEVFGGRTVRAPRPWHGKTSVIHHDERGIFQGLPQRLEVARYHSLVADRDTLGDDLDISAWTDDGLIMGVRHRRFPIEGVQFHPESYLTEHGHAMMRNFFAGVRHGERVKQLA